ncbi:MAG: ATP-binding cassette domain-containing protein [Tannerellaceae bacterium]|nr:ATP-binding cassette domain-containing protein [Tannerellaceae bacterium]
MNENILNGLLNLFAVFASIVKIGKEEAVGAVRSYLSSHFGVRSHEEHIELYNELRSLYDDSLYAINKENVVNNICRQMKVKLSAEEQMLLLVRFIEFAYGNSDEFGRHDKMFRNIADIFNVSEEEFNEAMAFISGMPSPAILTIGENDGAEGGHIRRDGMDGYINVWFISRFERYLFYYRGNGIVFMNDIPVVPAIFYSWQHSSVVRGPHFPPVYFTNLQAVFNKDKHKDAVRLSGRDINFEFAHSAVGIHNFSFDLEAGQLVAVMGSSGVGKSTLLSLLNGSFRIAESRAITINGYPVDSPQTRHYIGYVPQDDLLVEELTVYQNLWFTARFCFDGLDERETQLLVDKTLAELELSEIKHLKAGSPVNKTISGGQRKRLNIALELIREPAILLLDEPTSGLSSSDSEKLMMLLKEQTHKGKLIIANIHQPSSEIYKLFDRLWLLDKGGYPIYDGNPIEAITYFKHAARYTDQDISVCSACGNVNPELILNIIDAKVIDDSGNQTLIRMCKPEEWHEQYLNKRPTFDRIEPGTLPVNRQKRPSWLKQLAVFAERNIVTKLADTQFLLIALLEAPLLALIVALLTRYAPEEEYSLFANRNFVSYIFMAVIVVTFVGMSISAEEIIRDRALLKRERFLQLSRSAYLSAKMLCLLVLSGFQALLFVLVGNTIIGVGGEMFFAWWSLLWATAFLANLTGLWLSQTLTSVVSIYIVIPLLLIPQILLCGLVIPFRDLKSRNDDNLTPLIGDFIPSRWAFEALAVEQFTGNAYNSIFFPIEKEKITAQYYKDIHIPYLQSLLTADGEKTWINVEKTITNELPVLARAARISLPENESVEPAQFLDSADSAFQKRSHNYAAYLEKLKSDIINEKGNNYLKQLMHKAHNEALEAIMTAHEKNVLKTAHNRIFPQFAPVYFDPENHCGRAPFYSSTKKIGNDFYIPTFLFNLFVIATFAILMIIVIFADVPNRYLKNKNDY